MPGGHGLLEGGATLLSSHAGPSPTGDQRHSESQSGPTADSVKASQPAAGRSIGSRPDVTAPNQTNNAQATATSQTENLAQTSTCDRLAIVRTPCKRQFTPDVQKL